MEYYKTLGVESAASDEDIKKAYRKLALKYHPDRNQEDDAATKFKECVAAYDIIGDEQKRSNYDRFGSIEPMGHGDSPFTSHMHDFFSSMFGERGPIKGENIVIHEVIG